MNPAAPPARRLSGHSVAELADFPNAEIQRLVNGVGPKGTLVLEEALFGLLELGIATAPAKPAAIDVKNLPAGFDETAGG